MFVICKRYTGITLPWGHMSPIASHITDLRRFVPKRSRKTTKHQTPHYWFLLGETASERRILHMKSQ